MSNPHRTLAFYGLALSVIVAWACLGCVVRTANGQDARNPSDGVADRDRAYFPEAMALLDKSDAALGAQRYDDAIALARQVDPKVDEEKVHVEKTVAAGEAEWRIRDAAIVLEGLALRGAGRDLDALLAIRDRNFHAGACGDSLLARCGEHADWLKKTFPGVVKRAESISGRSATLTLWLDSAAQPDGVLDARAMHATMTMTEREIKAKTGYAGLLIEPMSSNGGKGGVTLRVEATGFQATSEECNKVASCASATDARLALLRKVLPPRREDARLGEVLRAHDAADSLLDAGDVVPGSECRMHLERRIDDCASPRVDLGARFLPWRLRVLAVHTSTVGTPTTKLPKIAPRQKRFYRQGAKPPRKDGLGWRPGVLR